MSFSKWLTASARNIAKRVWHRFPQSIRDRIRGPRSIVTGAVQGSPETIRLSLAIQGAARSLAQSGPRHIILPTDSAKSGLRRPLKIGFFGNIANNAYMFVQCLRRLGHDAELVIEDGLFDAFPLNRPYWENVAAECARMDDALEFEKGFVPKPWVRHVSFDAALAGRYQSRLTAIGEVQVLYKETFGTEIAADQALVLAQQMGHWPYLAAMARYDVVQLSGAPISLGAFCPRPYVAFPTGSDLFIAPFEQNVFGFLMRAGYKQASRVIVCEPNYDGYLNRLECSRPRDHLPLMLDTDTYAPGDAAGVRAEWQKAVGGSKYLFSVCRQSWEWKGSDRLLQAFRIVADELRDWRLIMQEWGVDVDKSKKLISELGLTDRVLWQPLCSKPRLRERQRAADAIADQFVMEGYGTSVLESLAAGKPVVMGPTHSVSATDPHLPIVSSASVEEIAASLRMLDARDRREEIGQASRNWVVRAHGGSQLSPQYMQVYADAARGNEGATYGVSASVPETPEQLFQKLRQLSAALREKVKRDFNRSVPWADQISDRWERAKFLGFGEGASIYDSALVLGDVTVGSNTWIGPQCVLDGSAGLTIGSNCSVATGCQIYSHDSVDWALTGGKAPFRKIPTRVGSNCYLGPGTILAAGTELGDHCLVGALSLVKGKFPANSILAGIPAKVVGTVTLCAEGGVKLNYACRANASDSKNPSANE